MGKNAVLRTSEYNAGYKCLVPRAPAFGLLSRHDVDEIVARLTRPTVASQGISGASERNMVEEQAATHPKYLGLKDVSKEEADQITSRVSKPTRMSLIRDRSLQNSRNDMPDVEN